MNLLDIKNYSLSLKLESGTYSVLNNISLSVPLKSIISLVGESGCGKSMTAMSILRLLPKNAVINSGEIYFNDQNLLNLKQSEMQKIRGGDIALIPQDPMTSLNPLYTIGNQIIEIIKKNSDINHNLAVKKAIEVLDIVKIPNAKNVLSMYPHEFSGGMQQRTIIAMALATNAKLIIADEPTTALDVTIQAQIMNILNDIKNERETSVLLISHDLNLVGEYSDEINVMYAGEIVETSDTKVFFNNPSHPYSIALLNSLPGNNNKEKLQPIIGQPPNIQENISGCKFNPRCDYLLSDICCNNIPQSVKLENKHFVKCHRYK